MAADISTQPQPQPRQKAISPQDSNARPADGAASQPAHHAAASVPAPGLPAGSADQREPWGWTRRHQIAIGMLLVLGLFFLFVQAWRHGYILRPAVTLDSHALELERRIDPNTASAASLARLPGIGMLRARKIVAYRKTHGAAGRVPFLRPADLHKIRGFGAKIIRRISPFLKFPAAPQAPPPQRQ